MSTLSQPPVRIGPRPSVIGMTLVLATLGLGAVLLAQGPPNEHWVATWATADVGRPQNPALPVPQPAPFMRNACPALPVAVAPVQPAPGQTFAPQPFVHFTNQTVREIVHTTIDGTTARVVLSNAYGTAPLTIGAAQIALRDKEASIQPGTSRLLTFSGRSTAIIPAGAVLYSDPVAVNVPRMGDLAIDIYLPGTTNTPSPLTMHTAAFQTNYVSESGNHVGEPAFQTVATIRSWIALARVDVLELDSVEGLVVFGDSITDGTRSTPDANNRWADQLMRRFTSTPGAPRMAIANAGIAGNRVLSDGAGVSALARFDADALSYPGVTHIIVLEGINDIGRARQNPTPTAEDIIAGHKQLIERAHTRGIRIFGATLTPFYGAAYYTEVGETKRQALNEWIRTSGAYDGVIDFDLATRDPNNPKMFLPAYDSCDHLHPNDAGYKAMADAVDLALFKAGAVARSAVR